MVIEWLNMKIKANFVWVLIFANKKLFRLKSVEQTDTKSPPKSWDLRVKLMENASE